MQTSQRLQSLRERVFAMKGEKTLLEEQIRATDAEVDQLGRYLALNEPIENALDQLSELLLGSVARVIEEQLTVAVQEVLEQPVTLRVDRSFKRGVMTMEFSIERDGHREDIMKGQGGSVANILSTGLRLFALTVLDESSHRRFLVLDEQDCWLRPDYVPRFVKIVHDAGKALGFQIVMVSHHGTDTFAGLADKIITLNPTPEGIVLADAQAPAPVRDHDS